MTNTYTDTAKQLIINDITDVDTSSITFNTNELYLAPDSAVYSVNNVSPVNGNVTLSIPTDTSDLTNGAGFISSIPSSYLENKTTALFSLNINGSLTDNTAQYATRVGSDTHALKYGVALGYGANANAQGAISVGVNASVGASYAIQLGNGSNSTASTLSVGFGNSLNYQLLDGTTGLIPYARINNVTDNNTGSLKFWSGTKAQYDAITTKDTGTLYNITDDNTADAYQAYTKSEVDTLLSSIPHIVSRTTNTSDGVVEIWSDGFYVETGRTSNFTNTTASSGDNKTVTLTNSITTLKTFTANLVKDVNVGNGSTSGFSYRVVMAQCNLTNGNQLTIHQWANSNASGTGVCAVWRVEGYL